MQKKLVLFLFSLVASIDSAIASDSSGDPAAIEELVVIETRIRDNIFASGEAISVDTTDLSRIQPADAEQLFQRLPGFSVSRPGGPGGVTEIFLRGAESNFTAVILDGLRLNNPTNTRGGSFDFSFLATQDIDRVDVATGAMSAVYGADAMAGVIRIQSAWPEINSQAVLAEFGSVGDWSAGAATTIGLGQDAEWNIRASATDGGHEIDGSSLRRRSIASRLAGHWPGGTPWKINVRHVQRERVSFPEVSGGPELAVSPELERADGDEFSIAASTSWAISDVWKSELYVSAVKIRDESIVPAVPPGILDGQPAFTSDSEYQRAELLWINHVEFSQSLKFVTGIDFVADDGKDDGSVDLGFAILPNSYELDRDVGSLFAELGKDWGKGWTTALAVRWDEVDDERLLSGKLGISKRISSSGSRAWGRIANGFKLPSFFALGNPLFGNPDLVPEKARSAEIGYTHIWGDGNEIVLSAFAAQYDDLVDFDFDTFSNINRGRIEVDGLEVRAHLILADNLRLRLDGTWSNISSGSEPLRRRPETTGGANLEWSINDSWQLDAVARYVGSRLMTSIPTGDNVDDAYTVLGTTVTFERSQNQSFWLAIDNLLDTSYQDAPGFPSQGLRARIGVKLML